MASERLVFKMAYSKPCKHSVVFVHTDDVGRDTVRTVYLMRTGWNELGEPQRIKMTIEVVD